MNDARREPTRRRRWISVFANAILCLAVLAMSAAAIVVINRTEPTAEQVNTRRKSAALVETVRVKRGAYCPELVVLGTVQPAQDIVLSPRVRGQVVKLSTKFVPGEIVKDGELLLQIDPADFENAVSIRQSELQQAQASQEIEEGRFRQDLYYRIKIVTVQLDPLAQRRDDILPLADHFRRQANKKYGKKSRTFSQELRRWMLYYDWPGNVRQLKNVVESLVVLDIDELLDIDDLSPDLLEDQPISGTPAVVPPSGLKPESELVGKTLKEIERWAIEQTLKLTGGNREETARILGISERNLYRKLKEYELR